MSFQTGLSGLNASSRSLDVIGNNIANANTTGMKASRTEFGDMVAGSLNVVQTTNPGIGVYVAAVSQQFSQGGISTTGNNLDAAINGSGFFQLTLPDGTTGYTRDGSFKLDKDGFIKTNSGANVMGYPTDKTGKPSSATVQNLQMPTNKPIAASATTAITAEFNLDARAQLAAGAVAVVGPPAVAAIPATPRSTYGTSLNVYDAAGVASPVNLYFEKSATANTWNVFTSLDTTAQPSTTPVATLTFDAAGKITGPTATAPATGIGITLKGGSIASLNPNASAKTIPQDIALDMSTVTQFGTSFAVTNLTQDGYTSGELTNLSIGENGIITARYSNGQTQATGQLTLTDFRNVQGLTPVGSNTWVATFASGQPVVDKPGNGKFGILRAGALEDSNVDLTAELVNMMTAQRAYQANAQTIKTQDQVMSTLVNLR